MYQQHMFNKLLSKMQTFSRALKFASKKHQNQRRKQAGDIPYINHPIEVADILIRAGVRDQNVLAAALLHDTVEDTETTEAELEKEFGNKIKDIVMECSDNKALAKDQRKRAQIEKALKASSEAKLVKLADKISNCGGLLHEVPIGWSPQRVRNYFIWSQAVCNNLKGTNEILDKEIDIILDKSGINSLSAAQKKEELNKYFESLSKIHDDS